jgi:hypothetical protein
VSKKFSDNIFTAILIFGFCCLIYFGYNTWQKSEEAAYESCIGSLTNEIQKSESAKNLFPASDDWKILSESETTFLMQNVRGSDCGRFNNPILDLWNHRINIALRKSSNYPQIIIWSNGKDNISGTDDDLVVPYKQAVPK